MTSSTAPARLAGDQRTRGNMRTIFAAAAALLTACATQTPVPPEVAQIAHEPLICKSQEECRVWWQRAQVWVVRNSRWKIQTANDTIIETYSGRRDGVDRSFQVVKEPHGQDGAQILFRSGCGNMFGCATNEVEAAAQFKMYVRFGGR